MIGAGKHRSKTSRDISRQEIFPLLNFEKCERPYLVYTVYNFSVPDLIKWEPVLSEGFWCFDQYSYFPKVMTQESEIMLNFCSSIAPTIWDQVYVSIWSGLLSLKLEWLEQVNMGLKFLEVLGDKKSLHCKISRNMKGHILCRLFTILQYLISKSESLRWEKFFGGFTNIPIFQQLWLKRVKSWSTFAQQ